MKHLISATGLLIFLFTVIACKKKENEEVTPPNTEEEVKMTLADSVEAIIVFKGSITMDDTTPGSIGVKLSDGRFKANIINVTDLHNEPTSIDAFSSNTTSTLLATADKLTLVAHSTLTIENELINSYEIQSAYLSSDAAFIFDSLLGISKLDLPSLGKNKTLAIPEDLYMYNVRDMLQVNNILFIAPILGNYSRQNKIIAYDLDNDSYGLIEVGEKPTSFFFDDNNTLSVLCSGKQGYNYLDDTTWVTMPDTKVSYHTINTTTLEANDFQTFSDNYSTFFPYASFQWSENKQHLMFSLEDKIRLREGNSWRNILSGNAIEGLSTFGVKNSGAISVLLTDGFNQNGTLVEYAANGSTQNSTSISKNPIGIIFKQ